jgi:hypothetical protein
MPLLLGVMISMKPAAGRGGFVEVSSISDALQKKGFHPEQIDRCVDRALEKNLLQARLADPEQDPPAVRPTTIGAYHFGPLVRQFTYVDAVLVDTPILNQDFRNRITNVDSIQERLDRAIVFVDYLDMQWADGGLVPDVFDWPSISESLRQNIVDIRGKALA